MVAEARERIRAAGLGKRASVELAPAGRLPMQSCSVDACRSDRLLMHLETPAEAIGEMVRILKPGGRVVCIEPDWATLSIDCESSEVERRLARFTAESALAFGFAGRRLPSLMSRAGLEDRSVEVHAVSVSNYRLARYLVCFDRVHVAATDAGLVTEAELGRLYGELELAEREHRFYGSLNLVVAAGRKRPVI
jgi:SAM-dependent methyltransferase